jgi:hypothetical protein
MSDAEKPLREEAWNKTWITVRGVLQWNITRITDKTSLKLAFCRLCRLFTPWMGFWPPFPLPFQGLEKAVVVYRETREHK